MKIYIAGLITNNPDYKNSFVMQKISRKRGHSVMNPAWIVPGKEFSYDDYISVSKSILQVIDGLKDDRKQRRTFDISDRP